MPGAVTTQGEEVFRGRLQHPSSISPSRNGRRRGAPHAPRCRVVARRVEPERVEVRSECVVAVGGGHAGSRARAHPPRADAGVAVRVLPGRGGRSWRRILRRHRHRAPGAGLRRRASRQLRWLRGAGSRPGVRHQRLRRDEPRAVRMGRQASGRELRDRGSAAGALAEGRHATLVLDRGPCVPGSDGTVRGDGEPRRVVLAPRREGPARVLARRADRGRGEARRTQLGEGQGQGQREGARQAHPSSSTASTGSRATRRWWSRSRICCPTREAERAQRLARRSGSARTGAASQHDRRHLLEGYRMVDFARKVVGVGSVGTRCWIVLLFGKDDGDPLFLQIKEAEASVLEPIRAKSEYAHHGQRVVEGQRLLQAASDIFLGWVRAVGIDGVERDFYVRQMWDSKISRRRRHDAAEDARVLCADVRVDAGPRACPVGRPGRDRRVPGLGRHVRPRHRRLRVGLRRPERTRLRIGCSRAVSTAELPTLEPGASVTNLLR